MSDKEVELSTRPPFIPPLTDKCLQQINKLANDWNNKQNISNVKKSAALIACDTDDANNVLFSIDRAHGKVHVVSAGDIDANLSNIISLSDLFEHIEHSARPGSAYEPGGSLSIGNIKDRLEPVLRSLDTQKGFRYLHPYSGPLRARRGGGKTKKRKTRKSKTRKTKRTKRTKRTKTRRHRKH